jgi:sugar O-acyltransferase (sialic acid O-acetyltransferase NeuD family)
MRVLVVGGGGFAMACIDVLGSSGLDVGGPVEVDGDLDRSIIDGADVFVAVMDNRARQMVSHEVATLGGRLVTALSPRAVVSPSARISAGAVLMPGAVVNAAASIGKGAIVNTNAAVDHEASVGAFAHVAVGASLAGNVSVGDGALIGVGASVTPGRTIGAWSTVGAGSAVVRDVAPGATVAGVPAKTTYGSALLR